MPVVTAFSRYSAQIFVVALLTGLAACQSSPQPPSSVGPGGPVPTVAPPATVRAEDATFAFEPFTGAPGNIADELSESIGEQARRQGLTLVRRVGAQATYRVNGYLSAAGEPSSATVFYVFDVVDSSGRRLKRISGTERTSGTAGDPWQAVDGRTLDRIANRSVVELEAWLNSR
ncbi:hypothetical protein JM93_02855 [Roseibium hamelinense]|uniref:Lipoprotein n=2 Tax=Roseibium hamelinense TaxID=150831 RepID=A0A562SXR9_9HYPH|nr:hypothetical protein [Roseibium hamelinense]TWI86147.1 hypothetical protein JM93_02855 [Roseibium hamelinense]